MKLKLLGAVALIALPHAQTQAATALAQLRYTPDITVSLGGATIGPQSVADDDLAGTVSVALDALPAPLAAYHYTGSVHWLVFDTTVALPGGITASPRDVISWDGSNYGLLLDGAAAGIPLGVKIDALSSLDGTDYLISFDTTTSLGGSNADPNFVMNYKGGTWSSFFSATQAGVTASANLDALHRLDNGNLLVSFDISGTVADVNFSDEDVLEFAPVGSVWSLAYRGAAFDANWAPADLKALWVQAAPTAPGVLQFSTASYTATESGGLVTINVLRVGGATGTVGVSYNTADDTALQPADYVAANGTLTWASGDTQPKSFTVAIVNDGTMESSETLKLVLSSPSGGASLGAIAEATLAIADDDLAPNTPAAQVSTATANFGNQAVSTTGAPQTIVVTNVGNAPLTVSAVTLTGTHWGDFSLLSNGCLSGPLAPSATCSVTLAFAPSASGARAATLSIISNDPTSPLAVPLNGTGLASSPGDGGGGSGGVTPVPSLSAWASALLGLVLAAFGALRQRRQH